jgi:peptidoglycan hydrolase-like protein with peptidoglycan-binding domain
MESDQAPQPLVAEVLALKRAETTTVEAHVLAAEERPVKTRSSGTVTEIAIRPGEPVVTGTTAMAVDGMPVVAFTAPAPLYRDIEAGATGEDVRIAQEQLVELGFLERVDGIAGPSTVRAIELFNSTLGRPHGSVLAAESLLWIPPGAAVPASVPVAVGDVLTPQDVVYSASIASERVRVDIEPSSSDRTVAIGDVEVVLPANTDEITEAEAVDAVRATTTGEDDHLAVVTALESIEIGVIPASAVVTDARGSTCFLTGANGPVVNIELAGESLGVVEVDARLIGTPVVTNPREARLEIACG